MEKFNDILEKIGALNAMELSELVKAMEEKFGISAAMPVMAAGAGAGAGDAGGEEKTAWNVVLKDGGAQKIQVIKVIKEALNIGLQEAKALVDGAPKAVKEGLKKDEAEALKKQLETAGAVVELQ
jgi:large subunit ribosomal protein L7/L12